jgi:hypothetical protein
VAQLARRSPKRLYRQLERTTGKKQDPCVLDTFRAAVAQALDVPDNTSASPGTCSRSAKLEIGGLNVNVSVTGNAPTGTHSPDRNAAVLFADYDAGNCLT